METKPNVLVDELCFASFVLFQITSLFVSLAAGCTAVSLIHHRAAKAGRFATGLRELASAAAAAAVSEQPRPKH